MDEVILEDKKLKAILHSFIFPFSIKENCQSDLKTEMNRQGFEFFTLKDLRLENAYYGNFRVSHRNMERYYLPFTANVLFPHKEEADSFQRFSKSFDFTCDLKSPRYSIPFRIISVDVFLCPFQLGLITIRTEVISDETDYSLALEFANRFRVLQDVSTEDNAAFILCDDTEFQEVEVFIFNKLAPFIVPFLDKSDMEGAYFETLPFFVDEKMYVQAVYCFEEDQALDRTDLFRAAQLDGLDLKGKPYISANNRKYIQDYCTKHGYERWSPRTFYMVNEHAFSCLTNNSAYFVPLANQMYGEYYYGMLLNLFHKIVLLKLSDQYSKIRVEKDKNKIEHLIRDITFFSSRYFFLELVSQSQGKEIFMQLRTIYGNDELYADVKQTLNDLFENQRQTAAKGLNYLLLILTSYTVVSGIYGMNQVIEDLKGNIDWNKLTHYSLFEWIAFFVTFSGLIVGFALGITVLLQWGRDKVKKMR